MNNKLDGNNDKIPPVYHVYAGFIKYSNECSKLYKIKMLNIIFLSDKNCFL